MTVNAIIQGLGHLPPALTYAVVAAAVLAEMILVIGAFVPTLTLLLTAGALARTGHINLFLVIAVAATGAAAGDFLAHRTGRLLSHRLRTGRLGGHIPATAQGRAEALMTRHGGRAVFLARFLPVLRTLTPYLAGATSLPYHRIAPYSLTAALLWATAEAGAGYAAATSLQHLLTMSGPAIALVVLIALGAALLRRHYSRPARRTDTPASASSRPDHDRLPVPPATR
ncbi:VTT domain-containing protein [Streptomyces sp. NPDC001508]|uniref:DedA family protein n=1 Tax=Streptomyces sp. NPDC001508 TaxID=3154656 RepID=UPI003320E8A1